MPDSKDALKNSIFALKGAYTVITGLALQKGVISFITPQEGGETLSVLELFRLPFSSWVFFIVFLFTVIRFLHGAVRHLDFVYVERSEILKHPGTSGTIDFILFFVEGILFVILSFLQANQQKFIITYAALFVVDIIWAQASLWLLKRLEKSHLATWQNNNVIALAAFVTLYLIWPRIDERYHDVLLPLAFFFTFALNTAVDYKLQWRFYFPLRQDGQS